MILTIPKYAATRNWSRQAVYNNIKRGNLLPGVIKIVFSKKRRKYLLTVK